MSKKTIHVAHSPDSDDAFMFYALAEGKIPTGKYEFVHHLDDIETLNARAEEGLYEVTALSIHAFAGLADRYALMHCGASMGEGYGPILVARDPIEADQIKGMRIAVPGLRTSAYLALKLFQPDFEPVVVPFDRITAAVDREDVPAGLLIHEGQLFYPEQGLHKVLDLGEWWKQETGLPLPLGGNGIRRDLSAREMRDVGTLIEESIRYALQHRQDALSHALEYGRGLDWAQGAQFVSMYVNERTLDYGIEGRRAVQLFLDRGHEAGLLPHRVHVEFV